jgi:hypothetical protein
MFRSSYLTRLRTACCVLTGFALLTLATGCSSTSYYGDWQGPRPLLLPYSKMLIVADTPNTALRQELEQQLVSGIELGGTLVTATINLKSGDKPISQENLVLMLEEAYADSLLLLRITHLTATADDNPPESIDIAPQTDSSTLPAHEMLANNSAIVEATVYDVNAGGRAVYIIDIETIFKDEGDDTIY